MPPHPGAYSTSTAAVLACRDIYKIQRDLGLWIKFREPNRHRKPLRRRSMNDCISRAAAPNISDPEILAVFAHELGHAHGRHGLQLLLQSSAVGAFWTLYVGDISSLLAAAPAAVVQARYSQDLEQQADDYGAALLMRNGMSPALLAGALKKLAESHSGSSEGGYLSSHPSTDERMRHLRQLAASFSDN